MNVDVTSRLRGQSTVIVCGMETLFNMLSNTNELHKRK